MTASFYRRVFRAHHKPFTSVAVVAAAVLFGGALTGIAMAPSPARAQVLGYANEAPSLFSPGGDDGVVPPQDSATDQSSDINVLPAQFRRQVVTYVTAEPPGTIIVDTPHTVLYYVLGDHRAIRYGIGVGREGFTWSGTQTVTRKAEWPDWIPPSQMIARQPYLPRFVAGGPGNPLGARAMYLGASEYRIHGTNDPTTIGKFVSSGCIRLTNTDVEDLFNRVSVGTKVVVLPKTSTHERAAVLAPVHSAARPVASNLTVTGLY